MKRFFTCFIIVTALMGMQNSNAQSYCSSYLESYEYITNVTFQEIDNTTEYVDGEPADYTDLGPANVTAGATYPLSVSLEPDADDYVSVFIDWNQNGTLDDTGEEYVVVEATSSSGPHTIDIAVPSDALPGETRMRVILVWDDIPTPCYDEFLAYGEAEDYTVNVTTGCDIPSSVSFSEISGTSASVNWNQPGDPEGWVILYGESGFDAATEGISVFTTSKPYVIGGLSLATDYDVYIMAICSGDDSSSWSPASGFSTLCVLPAVTSVKDSSNCGAGVVTLEATASAGAVIKWYTSLDDYEPIATGSSFTTPFLSEDAIYYVAASGPTSCENTTREPVTAAILELPVIALNDTFVCPGSSLVLDAGNPGSSFLWSTGAVTQAITIDATGTYSVTVTAADNCSVTDEVIVTMPPAASVGGFNFIPLYGDVPGTVRFSAIDPVNVLSYEWNFGDGSPLSHEESPIHLYTASGSFTVTLNASNGCEDNQVSLPINVDLPTGMVTLVQQPVLLNIYPNPAKEVLNINIPDQEISSVRLYNALGSLMYEASVNGRSFSIPVAELAAGFYLLQVSAGSNTSTAKIEIIK